tara:strand:- start:1459 stop:1938 length:480 start_codon:yes stop_codon:yes gene_type:complete
MHYKRNNKESKTYVQGLRAFGHTLPRGIRGILKKNGYNYLEIIGKWKFLVGKDISSFCYPRSIKMKNGNKDGTLVLAVERGNEITIEYSKKEIINKINSFFGYKLINEIRLHTVNLANNKKRDRSIPNKSTKKMKEKINEISSESIKSSLSQLIDIIKK